MGSPASDSLTAYFFSGHPSITAVITVPCHAILRSINIRPLGRRTAIQNRIYTGIGIGPDVALWFCPPRSEFPLDFCRQSVPVGSSDRSNIRRQNMTVFNIRRTDNIRLPVAAQHTQSVAKIDRIIPGYTLNRPFFINLARTYLGKRIGTGKTRIKCKSKFIPLHHSPVLLLRYLESTKLESSYV